MTSACRDIYIIHGRRGYVRPISLRHYLEAHRASSALLRAESLSLSPIMGFFSSKKKAPKAPKDNGSNYQGAGAPSGQSTTFGSAWGPGFGSAQPPTYPYASHSNITNVSGSGSEYEMSSWKSPGYTPGYTPSILGASRTSSRAPSVPPVVGSKQPSPASSTSLYPRSSNSGSGAAPGSGDSADRRGRSSEPQGHRSRSSSRNVFYFESDNPDNRDRFTKSPSPTGSWEPTAGPSGQGKSHMKSKFFGSSSSSGPTGRSPSAAPSSGRGTASGSGSGLFGSSSGSSSGKSVGPFEGRPIINSTSFVSGYSDQFTPSGRKFLPDSQLEKEYRAYKNEGYRSKEAGDAYKKLLAQTPHRKKQTTGGNIALGASNPIINKNLTLDERKYSEPSSYSEQILTRFWG